MSMPLVSYAQRFEDLYLMRCFGDRREGLYIDIGSGHPVYDNMSFAFYLKGWSGITVEPNPWLARLTKAVRPRDRHLQTLVGAASGETTFFIVRDFHGLSTAIESHAHAAQSQFGKGSEELMVPVTTLSELCAAHVPASFDFLKIDVEGAEKDVLLSGDWQNYRPKVVVVEALAPYSLAPAWQDWEPFLTKHGYRYVLFDSLNRYYLAEEASELADRLEAAPASFDDAIQFRNLKPALVDNAHPDRQLATVIANAAMTRLPLWDRAVLCELLTADLTAGDLEKTADADAVTRIAKRLFGTHPTPEWISHLNLPDRASVRDIYVALVETDLFRAACGRISASYAW
jgi:FkbM family methyltransferase